MSFNWALQKTPAVLKENGLW